MFVLSTSHAKKDKLSELLEPNRPKFLGLKNQAIRKTLKKKTVRTPRENLKIFQIQSKKQNRQTFWIIKNLLKKTRQKTLVTIPRKKKIFQIQTKKQNRQTFWRIKNLLKQTRRKTLVTKPK